MYNVAYLLKAKTMDLEEQQLLANGSETTFNGRETNNGKTSVAMR
jgi:hypothetical protein